MKPPGIVNRFLRSKRVETGHVVLHMTTEGVNRVQDRGRGYRATRFALLLEPFLESGGDSSLSSS